MRAYRASARAWLQCARDSQLRIISWKFRRLRALANAVAKFIKTLHEGINFDPAGLETKRVEHIVNASAEDLKAYELAAFIIDYIV